MEPNGGAHRDGRPAGEAVRRRAGAAARHLAGGGRAGRGGAGVGAGCRTGRNCRWGGLRGASSLRAESQRRGPASASAPLLARIRVGRKRERRSHRTYLIILPAVTGSVGSIASLRPLGLPLSISWSPSSLSNTVCLRVLCLRRPAKLKTQRRGDSAPARRGEGGRPQVASGPAAGTVPGNAATRI